MYAIQVSRSAGQSTMGHYFPAESRLLKSKGKTLQFKHQQDAEKVAAHYRQQPAFGFTAKTYRVIPLEGVIS